MRSVRYVDAHTVAVRDDLPLQFRPHAVQHLKLEAIGRDAALAHIGANLVDQLAIVSRKGRIVPAFEQFFRERQVCARINGISLIAISGVSL